MFKKNSIPDHFPKKSTFLEKLRFSKKIKHYHQEKHSKAYQRVEYRSKKKERKPRKKKRFLTKTTMMKWIVKAPHTPSSNHNTKLT